MIWLYDILENRLKVLTVTNFPDFATGPSPSFISWITTPPESVFFPGLLDGLLGIRVSFSGLFFFTLGVDWLLTGIPFACGLFFELLVGFDSSADSFAEEFSSSSSSPSSSTSSSYQNAFSIIQWFGQIILDETYDI